MRNRPCVLTARYPNTPTGHRGLRHRYPVTGVTVFMERDINYFFAEGYGKNEILASVLHSVRDNYLTKVANIAQIGDRVVFQGATARNRALVAAFEQKLNKPIHVSRYCHLTGALGIALMARQMKEQGELSESGFRGFNLWKERIPVRQEVCRLCTNHCKITIAEVKGTAPGLWIFMRQGLPDEKTGELSGSLRSYKN